MPIQQQPKKRRMLGTTGLHMPFTSYAWFCEFEHAVCHADAGRVIRIFKYWAFAFRGAGQHNYARECVEVLVKWKYELTDALRTALEKSWFVNRWGKEGRWIASDLYLEQLNFWVKVGAQCCLQFNNTDHQP
jgi:hypothetical protein